MTLRIFFGLALWWACAGATAFESTLVLTREDLQARVERLFPVTLSVPFARVVVSHPRIDLHPTRNRLAIDVAVSAHADQILLGRGRARIEGRLAYRSNEGAFYLLDSGVTGLQIEQMAQELLPAVRAAVSDALAEVLDRYPVYALDDADLRQRFIKRRLLSIEVRDGTLVATFAL